MASTPQGKRAAARRNFLKTWAVLIPAPVKDQPLSDLLPRLVPSILTVMIQDLGSRRSTCVNTVDTWLLLVQQDRYWNMDSQHKHCFQCRFQSNLEVC